MSRIKLIFPEPHMFETSLEVRIQDINYGGHVGNDRVLGIMHEVRLQWLNSLGYSSEVGIEDNIGIIVTEAHIQYKSEAFYGNVLQARLSISNLSEVAMDVYYELHNATSGKLSAIGKTLIVFFNYDKRKISNIPEELKNKLPHGN